jgi:hypothetical protein
MVGPGSIGGGNLGMLGAMFGEGMGTASAKANQSLQQMDQMQQLQEATEMASKMKQFQFNLAKGVRDAKMGGSEGQREGLLGGHSREGLS